VKLKKSESIGFVISELELQKLVWFQLGTA